MVRTRLRMAAPLLTEDSLFRLEKVVCDLTPRRSRDNDWSRLTILKSVRETIFPFALHCQPNPALGIVLIWESSPEPRLILLRIDHAAKTDGAGAVTSRRHQ